MIEHFSIVAYTAPDRLRAIFVSAVLELLVWATVLVISERRRPLFATAFARLEHSFNSVARHRVRVVAAVFLLIFAGRLALLPVAPVPPPKITDEFSQLLAADTFASGRVTNPTHPMAFYFETFFVNQSPTYHSMYPPATGFFMAVAQALTGQPWYGMLFTVAVAAAAICWMLQGWMPPQWALWGAVLFVLLAVKISLTENYFGEGIVVSGGALVLGAIPRIVRKRGIGASICLGVGLALLATSRPYEGAVLAAGLCLGASFWAWKSGLSPLTLFKRVVLPVVMILLPVFLALGYLNWRATGSPWLAPYQLNLVQQHITRPLVWQRPADPLPHYNHAAMASAYQLWELGWWKSTREFPRGVLLFLTDKLDVIYWAILWPLVLVVGVGFRQLLKHKSKRFLPLAFAFFMLGLFVESYQLLPRYAEAAWGLVILLAVFGVRYVGSWKRGTHHGLRISRAAMVALPAALLLANVGFLLAGSHTYYYKARWQLSQTLEALPGKQLVIVRYSPSHRPNEEWVYNRADIDAAKVVWAREVSDSGNENLLRYFAGRTAWLLEPDGKNLKVMPYFGAGSNATLAGAFQVSCSSPKCEELKMASSLFVDGIQRISLSWWAR